MIAMVISSLKLVLCSFREILGIKQRLRIPCLVSLDIKPETDKYGDDESNKLDIFVQTNYIHNTVTAFFLYCTNKLEAKMRRALWPHTEVSMA